MHARAALMVLALALTGCVGDPDDVASDAGSPVFGIASGLPDTRDAASLDAPPAWALGEWWRYRLYTDLYHQETELTIVVAGLETDHYLVGLPLEDHPVLPFIMHLPGIGQVSRADLSYEAHDVPFQLLSFPLVEGASWEGKYWGARDMTVEVASVDGARASLRLEATGVVSDFVYDGEVGALAEYTAVAPNGVVTYALELLDHGFGFDGPVRVPYGQDLLFCHGRGQLVMSIEMCAPADPSAPSGTVEIPEGYDQASVALVVNRGDLPSGDTAPGAITIRATTPAGTEYEARSLPGDTSTMLTFEEDEPVGTWSYEVVAASPGAAIIEGVVYRAFDVELPSGCRLTPLPPDVTAEACSA